MAKAKTTKAKGSPKTKQAKNQGAAVAAAQPVLTSLNIQDTNPRNLEGVAGASRGDFVFKSDSEPRLEATADQANENADLVGAAWQDRIAREGTPYFVCPICTGAERPFEAKKESDAKKACAQHIKTEHPARVKELKLINAPKERYTPVRKIKSPKRTMADAIHPKYREQVEMAAKMRENLKPLSDQAMALSTGNSNSIIKLASLTESLAVQKLKTLSDKDLIAVAQIAQNRGKRLLARAARQLCEQKKLNMNAPAAVSDKQRQLQNALLSASFAAQQTVRKHG